MLQFGQVDVSVCITTYNHVDHIRQCILSVVAQAQEVALEIIVGDDASSDGTGAVLTELSARFPDLIRVITHQPRLGLGSSNLQKILPLASGRFIAHLDGDDFWLYGKLAEQLAFMEARPDCIAVYTNAICVGKSGNMLGLFNNPQKRQVLSRADLLRDGNFLNHSSLLYRSEGREPILALSLPFIDFDVHLQLADLGDLGYLDRPLGGYRVGSESSAMANRGRDIQERYWESVRKALSKENDTELVCQASVDFLRRVVVRAIRTRSWRDIGSWWSKVTGGSLCSSLHLFFNLWLRVIQVLWRELVVRVVIRVLKLQIRVFYWHG